MEIILFSSNKHKANEIENIFSNYKIRLYTDFIEPFDVFENGNNFKENALLKVESLKNELDSNMLKNYILMAEDSGICIEKLDNKPGIYSARYAKIKDFSDKESILTLEDCKDSENLQRVISELESKNLKSSPAIFISCIAVYKNDRFLSTHGFLSGEVVTKISGKNGFGYDPIFIPKGFEKTLASLSQKQKDSISHRFRALELMRLLLK